VSLPNIDHWLGWDNTRVKAEEVKEEDKEKRILLRKKMKTQSHLDDTPDKVGLCLCVSS
jgi:hypothetical protein